MGNDTFKSILSGDYIGFKDSVTTQIDTKVLEDIDEDTIAQINEAKKPKPFFGTVGDKSYAVNIDGIDNARVGRDLSVDREVFKFMTGKVDGVKKGYVGAKGKATLPAAKRWVKDNNATQFAAKWGADSSSYKNDSFEIYYKA